MSPLSTVPSVLNRLNRQSTYHTIDVVRTGVYLPSAYLDMFTIYSIIIVFAANTVSPMISCLQWLKNTETPTPADRSIDQVLFKCLYSIELYGFN